MKPITFHQRKGNLEWNNNGKFLTKFECTLSTILASLAAPHIQHNNQTMTSQKQNITVLLAGGNVP